MSNPTPAVEAPFDLTREEFWDLSRELEIYHTIFYKVWEMGKPRFTKDIPTAAIRFNTDGDYLEFIFNPDFWQSLTNLQRVFVICHEALHVILNHGERAKQVFQTKNMADLKAANIAMDIVINHMLVREFGFDRTLLNMEKYIWLETVFEDEKTRPTEGQNFESYYLAVQEELKKPKTRDDGEPEHFDDHSGLPSADEPTLKDEVKKAVEKLTDPELGEIKDSLESDLNDRERRAGTLPGGHLVDVSKRPVPKKRKWETVIKRWAIRHGDSDDTLEVWQDINRRTQGLLGKDMILPVEIKRDIPTRSAIDVYFFLDTSPSCRNLEARFWRASQSLPTDRFRAKLFTFHTSTALVKKGSGRLERGHGTSFCILEDQIQRDLQSGELREYPRAVFVITDGYGDSISPAKPKNWHWFLSMDHRDCIPRSSNVYDLKDFE